MVKELLRFFRPTRTASTAETKSPVEARLEQLLDIERTRRRNAQKKSKASGVKIAMGRFGYEDNDELKGKQRFVTLRNMTTDAHVKGTLRFNSLPLVNAKWEIKPASDDPRDIEIAEFCAANLLRQSSKKYGKKYWCKTPWKAQRLGEALTMLQYGFSATHKTWRVVDGKRVYDTLKWLEPHTIDPNGWMLDDEDNIVALLRTFSKPSGDHVVQEPVLASELHLFVWDMVGARYEGEPLIRSLFGPWYRKDQYLRATLAWAAKTGNPPPIGIFPSTGWGDEEIAKFEDLVEMLRGVPPDEAWGVFPRGDSNGPEIQYAASDIGEIDRMRSLIDGENAEIAHGGGTKSMLLGETRSGSRALGESIGKMESPQVGAVAEVLIEQISHGVANLPGFIEELVDENFADVEAYPTLTCDYADPLEKRQMALDLGTSIAAGALPPIPEVQFAAAQRFGLDIPIEVFQRAKEEADKKEMEKEKLKADAMKAKAKESSSQSEGGDVAAAADNVQMILSPLLMPVGEPAQGFHRAPNTLENDYVNLAAVMDTYRNGEAVILSELRSLHRLAIAEFVQRVRDGKVSKRNLDGVQRSRFKYGDKHLPDLVKIFTAVGEHGVDHVDAEIDAQSKAASLAARVRGKKVPPALSKEYQDEMNALGAFDIGQIWQRVVSEGIGEYLRKSRVNVSDAEMPRAIQGFLDGLSEKPLEALARRSSSVAYNQGRDMAIKTANESGLVDYVVRTAVLDKAVCDACKVLDKKVIKVASPQYAEYHPPAKCLGTENCRCFYVSIRRAPGFSLESVKGDEDGERAPV